MLVGTWNINSIKIRKEQVEKLLSEKSIDILALQETKVKTEEFPTFIFKKLGYEVYHQGGKGRNGVAILSKFKAEEIITGFKGLKEEDQFPDVKERIIGVKFSSPNIKEYWVFSVYIPNGSPVNSDYYFYKLQFLWKFREFLEANFSVDHPLIIMGDFNVAPEEIDVYDPEILRENICFTERERKAFKAFLGFGLVDALRLKYPEKSGIFTWWDYQFSAFNKNQGMRLDHILITSSLIDKLENVWVEKTPRSWKKPSDHAPVLAEFKI
jgi:exodeoxyribonuclease-3